MEKGSLRKAIRTAIRRVREKDPFSFTLASQQVCAILREWILKQVEEEDAAVKPTSNDGLSSSTPLLSSSQDAISPREAHSVSLSSLVVSSSSSSSSLLCIGAYWALSTELSLEPLLNTLWSWRTERITEKGGENELERKSSRSIPLCKREQEEEYKKGTRKSWDGENGMDSSLDPFVAKEGKSGEETARKERDTIGQKEVAVALPVVLTAELHHFLHYAIQGQQGSRNEMPHVQEEKGKHGAQGLLPALPLSSVIEIPPGPSMFLLEVFDRADFEACFTSEGEGGSRCRSVPKEKLVEMFLCDGVEIFLPSHPHTWTLLVRTETPKEETEVMEERRRKGCKDVPDHSSFPLRSAMTFPREEREEEMEGRAAIDSQSPSSCSTLQDEKRSVEENTSSSRHRRRRVWLCDEWETLFPGCPLSVLPPSAASVVPPSRVELLLLTPGLGFTKEGDRLGKGGGFYDRFIRFYQGEKREGRESGKHLPSTPWAITTTAGSDGTCFSATAFLTVALKTVGVGFDCQLVDSGMVTMEEHDEKVSAVVTPSFSSLEKW